MIKQEFLAEYGLSQNQLAKALGISPNRIADIIANRRRISADTALRLSLYFGNSPEFWMNLQTHYDVKVARRKLKPQDAKRIRARRAGRPVARLEPMMGIGEGEQDGRLSRLIREGIVRPGRTPLARSLFTAQPPRPQRDASAVAALLAERRDSR
jgi:addiction module HigA family antidote